MILCSDLNSLPDPDVLAAHRSGNKEAFGVLYGRHVKRVQRFVASRLESKHASATDDIVQEVFVCFQGTDAPCLGDEGVRRWLHRCATRQVGMFFRHVRCQCRDTRREEAGDAYICVAISNSRDSELSDDLRESIATLPQTQREMVELVYLEGCTLREAAAKLDIPLTAAYRQVTAGTTRLRKLMEA